jgi:hypothetical protein
MAVMALGTDRPAPFTPRKIPSTHFTRAIVLLEGLGQLKNPVTSSGIEPETFRLVSWYIDQLRYRMLPNVP